MEDSGYRGQKTSARKNVPEGAGLPDSQEEAPVAPRGEKNAWIVQREKDGACDTGPKGIIILTTSDNGDPPERKRPADADAAALRDKVDRPTQTVGTPYATSG